MNRVPTPNMASITATRWFANTLEEEIARLHISKTALARVSQVERKTIYAWMEGYRSPRLENIAQLFAALGYDSITIPLKEVRKDGSQG